MEYWKVWGSATRLWGVQTTCQFKLKISLYRLLRFLNKPGQQKEKEKCLNDRRTIRIMSQKKVTACGKINVCSVTQWKPACKQMHCSRESHYQHPHIKTDIISKQQQEKHALHLNTSKKHTSRLMGSTNVTHIHPSPWTTRPCRGNEDMHGKVISHVYISLQAFVCHRIVKT